jgi:hypothetical protein
LQYQEATDCLNNYPRFYLESAPLRPWVMIVLQTRAF